MITKCLKLLLSAAVVPVRPTFQPDTFGINSMKLKKQQ